MAAPRLVIFDFDGTLADSGRWFLGIVDHLAERYAFRPVEPHEVEALRDRTTREVIRHLGIPAWKLPFIARYVRSLFALHTHEVSLFDGVGAMLEAIEAAGVPIALVTSNAEINARRILGEHAARIAVWECAVSLYGKAPRLRRVLRRTGIAAADTLAIGDETRDIEAARKVGMQAAGVLWGYASEASLMRCGPDRLFGSPEEVAGLFGEKVAAN
ncbi:HAD hydrolase-like protein [Sphingomonas baiyangensis]|uniref:HAD family hydrolase n=1 Tax=Sphingomonas baiyangensis TaxID=2572576 RepID=A0A4U1L3T3_9SPHN|nr:HAD hydrolase-like protein [Sphingomonas baiyangensis]TKD51144.1 HAD family hydrolase [Sphingomonas baiyangensis]